jgi:hypothetical protein
MKKRIFSRSIILMCFLALTASANGKSELQKYFNDTAVKVKATEIPAEKRAILSGSLRTMSSALEMVQRSASISNDDRAGIDRIATSIKEKQDELAGSNGFTRIADAQLNLFADFVVQDMEQADQMVSISVVTLLLILIIVILLF